jgi:hypothetical protein
VGSPFRAYTSSVGQLFYGYGYRHDEVKLITMPELKATAKFKRYFEPQDPMRRPPVLVSLGCHVDGVALPHPDPNDPRTMEAGVRYRFARACPARNKTKLIKFRLFVRNWLEKNMTPLECTSDISFKTWLANTNYPEWRKEELRRVHDKVVNINDPKYFKVKSFMKDECYPDYKHARGINARSDAFKCFMGPFFKLIEDQLYANPNFIKHVPVRDRAEYIYNRLYAVGGVYLATDFSSFESSFEKEFMEACEFELYEYMTQHLQHEETFRLFLKRVLAGVNKCQYKWFLVLLLATRMSGEMCTSLGNGFSNLMLMSFVCAEAGSAEIISVTEGDDGLSRVDGPPPTEKDFSDLGFTIKLEVHEKISTASFCGIVFDEDDKNNITDPRKVLASFGWTSARYAKSRTSKLGKLLRCKALSLAYQYPGCPIIQCLATYGLRVTRKFTLGNVLEDRSLPWWNRQLLAEVLAYHDERGIDPRPVGSNSRLLVEKLYNITVEAQYAIENYLNGLNEICPLQIPFIHDLVPFAWTDYWQKYVAPRTLDDYPGIIGNPRRDWLLLGFI